VVLTRAVTPGDLATSQADVILQNIKVLAIDQQTTQQNEAANVARAVTLEVNTLMAQKLALGNSIGRLSLVLQAAGSGQSQDAVPVSLADLTGTGVKSRTINIIRGAGRTAEPALRAATNTATPDPVQVQVQSAQRE
jgi:Flp pilus assembly protein CpaB